VRPMRSKSAPKDEGDRPEKRKPVNCHEHVPRASALTITEGVNARSAGARASALTSAEGVHANRVWRGGHLSKPAPTGASARSAGARGSARTSSYGADARRVRGGQRLEPVVEAEEEGGSAKKQRCVELQADQPAQESTLDCTPESVSVHKVTCVLNIYYTLFHPCRGYFSHCTSCSV
jgi:hypothetical protein